MNELRYEFTITTDGLELYLLGIHIETDSGEEFLEKNKFVARYDDGPIAPNLLPEIIGDLVRANCRDRYLPSEGRYVAVEKNSERVFSGVVESSDWWKNPFKIQELIYSRAKELGKEVFVVPVPKEVADKTPAVGIDEKGNLKTIL